MLTISNEYKNVSGVYEIHCLVNDYVYIGQTKDLYERCHDHKRKLRARTHHNPNLLKDYVLYDDDYFEFNVLEECSVGPLMDELEKKYIASARERANKCYNDFSGGRNHFETSEAFKLRAKENSSGRKDSEDTRRLKSENTKKQWENELYRSKMIESARNQWKDEHYRKIMLDAHKGKVYNNKFSLETVHEIRTRRSNGERIKDLATEYGVNPDAITKIVHYRTYKNV